MAIKYSILGLLHYKDMHGYKIKKHIERHFGHMWSINYGQIYPNLKALLDEGLAVVREDSRNGDKGPPRKLYSITPKGREEFKAWLEGPPERPMLLRDPFLMRFVFFGFGDAEKALKTIDQQIILYEEQLNDRVEYLKKWDKLETPVRLMAELGITFNRMFLDWLSNSRTALASAERLDGSAASDQAGD
ncbi:MAG: helix-turn-helix transcriptional regulator [Pseudomonadota bacterium]